MHFLLAAGDTLDSKQLRDDLMTLLIAGHETTAAVLTWTVYCLISRPEYAEKVAREVDEVLGVSSFVFLFFWRRRRREREKRGEQERGEFRRPQRHFYCRWCRLRLRAS